MRNSISMSNEFFTVNMSGTTRIFYMCEQSLEEGVQIELSFKACTRKKAVNKRKPSKTFVSTRLCFISNVHKH